MNPGCSVVSKRMAWGLGAELDGKGPGTLTDAPLPVVVLEHERAAGETADQVPREHAHGGLHVRGRVGGDRRRGHHRVLRVVHGRVGGVVGGGGAGRDGVGRGIGGVGRGRWWRHDAAGVQRVGVVVDERLA